MLKIAILDDEPISLGYTEKLLKSDYPDDVADIYTFSDIDSFNKSFDSDPFFFNIIITDIELQDTDGIEIAKYIRTRNNLVRIIYLTNHLEYATEVYDTEHTFYVLKNSAEERLPVAVKKAVSQLEKIRQEVIALQTVHNGTVLCKVQDILYAERIIRETVIRTAYGEERITLNLEKFEKLFRNNTMVRIHRSFLVNLRHIKKLSGSKIVLSDGTVLHITRNHEKQVKQELMNFIKDCQEINI